MSLRRVTIAYERVDDPVDGIRDYSVRLVEALVAHGLKAEVRSVSDVAAGAPGELGADDAVVIQYAPFAYGHWGFAPWLARAVWRLRRARPRPKLALMAHETYLPPRDLRTVGFAAWQIPQLLVLRALVDCVFGSVELYAERLGRGWPTRPAHHLPVGSPLPDRRAVRDMERAQLGAGEATVVLATLGTGRGSLLIDYLERAASALARDGQEVVVLNLGAGTPDIENDGSYRVVSPGKVSLERLACLLAAADVFAAPYTEGASTNRTTLVSALQHGLPVVSTDGYRTGELLRAASDAIRLVPVDRDDQFVAEVVRMGRDTRERQAAGRAGRALFETHFAWPVVAQSLVDALES